jgi:hypothetical protein
VVDTAGDSVLGEFDSVVNAVHCACRIQEDLAAINAERPAGERISTRIGVHLGDVIVEDYNVYGDGVNIAARLEPIADPGGICISEAVYQQVRDKLDVPVEDIGLRELKNIQYPVHIFKIAPLETVAPAASSEAALAYSPAPSAASDVAPPLRGVSWSLELSRPDTLILLLVGAVLLLSPVLLFPSQGALSTAGVVLIAVAVGRTLAKHSGSRRPLLIALGLAIASGAVWTNWSRVTNILFLLAGAILASAAGGGQRRSERQRRREERRRLRR